MKYQDQGSLPLASRIRQKRNLTVIANSPLFIWTISVVFVSLAGFAFTNYQRCVQESDSVIERFQRLSREIFTREEYLSNSIQAALRIQQVQEAFSKMPIVYSEFKDRTLFELNRERLQLERRIDFKPTDQMRREMSLGLRYRARDLMKFSGMIYSGRYEENLQDSDLDALKEFAASYLRTRLRNFEVIQFTYFYPNCNIQSVVKMALFGRRSEIVTTEAFGGFQGQIFRERVQQAP